MPSLKLVQVSMARTCNQRCNKLYTCKVWPYNLEVIMFRLHNNGIPLSQWSQFYDRSFLIYVSLWKDMTPNMEGIENLSVLLHTRGMNLYN